MGVKLDHLENVLSEKKMSQADLARRSGLSAHTVGRAVRDGERVSASSAKRIAKALRVEVDSLCCNRVAEDHEDLREQHIQPRRLKSSMAEKGMNPTEVAARAGLSIATVSSAMRGTRQPQRQTIQKIAGAVGEDITHPYSEQPRTHAPPVELRATAGQKGTIFYPEERSKATTTDVQEEQHAAGDGPVSDSTIAVPAKIAPAELGAGAEGQEKDRSTLEELYSHVQQTRQMMAALLEHVGVIEEYIRQAVVAGTEGQDGTW